MNIRFGNNFRKAEFFPYKKAIVKGGMEVFPDYEEYLSTLYKACKITGVKPDNHICFKDDEVAIMFSDGCISISKPEALVEGDW